MLVEVVPDSLFFCMMINQPEIGVFSLVNVMVLALVKTGLVLVTGIGTGESNVRFSTTLWEW